MSEFTLSVEQTDGSTIEVYSPYSYQRDFHSSVTPNVLALGTRNTGKSLMLRMDAIMRCLMIPNFRALILRRTMPELRQSHLTDIPIEMQKLGCGHYVESPNPTAKFDNGSLIFFRHCETQADILDFLSAQYGSIGFDELSTFERDQFLMISGAARAPKDAPYQAVVRAGSNPLGPGADWMYDWFIDKTVNLEDFPDYKPEDFEMQFSRLEQNLSADVEAYTARLRNMPAHVRKAWLEGERVDEGAYFSDFRRTKNGEPWHVIDEVPLWQGQQLFNLPWINIFRAVDWGYHPDPAVCLWIAVLPNGMAIVFKEKSWKSTLAADVAADIKRESDGMRIAETFCDPTMALKTGANYSISELFEQNGVPLTPALNDRILYGYSVHNYLNTIIDQRPQLQIVAPSGYYGCKDLIRTLPLQQMDKNDPRKLANGNDHWVVALAYFCMGNAPASQNPRVSSVPFWMQKPQPKSRRQSWGV